MRDWLNVVHNIDLYFDFRKVLLIRPKKMLCEDGNYRESRWFSPWRKVRFNSVEMLSKFDISQCVSITSCVAVCVLLIDTLL